MFNGMNGLEILKNWPRYEDGEPVRFGDEIHVENERPYPNFNIVVDRISFDKAGFIELFDDSNSEVEYRSGERIKRPAPKVLDADGVEIRVGDTVCGTRDMEPMRVVDTDSRECGFKRIKCEKEGDGFWFYCPDELTHKLPVIAADGRPLREGETVWDVDGRGPFVVWSLPEKSDMHVSLKKDGMFYYRHPEKLTHERPESKCRDCAHWQKDPTADNMGVCWFFYHEHEGQDCYAARRADIGACEEFMPRAKALAERGA